MKAPSFESSPFQLPGEVLRVLYAMPEQTPVPAWELVRPLLVLHPELGDGLAAKLAEAPGPQGGARHTAEEWFEELSRRYDAQRLPRLEVPYFILGLAQADEALARYLSDTGLGPALERELPLPLSEVMLPPAAGGAVPQQPPVQKGRLRKKKDPSAPPASEGGASLPRADYAVFHSDAATAEDGLFREGFAHALALWLRRIWEQDNGQAPFGKDDRAAGRSFMIHLYGPWGSGKTSLLMLLERRLARCPVRYGGRSHPWQVVWFNAWRHRHLEPMWWPLWNRIYRRLLHSLHGWQRLRFWVAEWWWRLRVNGFFRTPAVVGLALLMVAGLLIVLFSRQAPAQAWALLSEEVGALMAALGLAGSVGSALLSMGRALVSGEAAARFVRVGADPMEQIRAHFLDMVRRYGRPVLVCLDDLDRCQPEYVVGLLEHTQTLFSHPAVMYIAAADRRWLYECFEEVYARFTDRIREPGRPTGFLFLEKIFQMSISVPAMTDEQRQAFLDLLYGLGPRRSAEALQAMEAEAEAEFAEAHTTEELLARLEAHPETADPIRQQLRRQAAVRRLASQEVSEGIEHFLQPFAPLLEPNPRAIKRLVNAYSVALALALMSDAHQLRDEAHRKRFALWIILSLRWPLLAQALRRRPSLCDASDKARAAAWPEELLALWQDEAVQAVLQGRAEGVGVRLDAEAVRLCARLS